MKGLFITFEGPDGSGKTSVIKGLIPKLTSVVKKEIMITREPGGSRIAEKIRELILDPEHLEMDSRTEALLYAASRRQHLIEKVIPALKADQVVICDRFVDSSLVYQGWARGIGMTEVATINEFATEGVVPDITFYLDIDAKEGLERIKRARESRQYDRLDQEKLVFHEKVREGYLQLVKENKKRIVLVDASQPVEKVIEECYTTIMDQLS